MLAVSSIDDIGRDQKIVANEIGGARVMRMNAADSGGGEKHVIDSCALKTELTAA
jgi:hypothetical protein